MEPKQYVKLLIEVVQERACEYLRDEIGFEVMRVERQVDDVKRLGLKYLTSLLAIGGHLQVYLAFSFDEPLIRKIFEAYTRDVELDDDEDHYVAETAGDMINVVVGNALAALGDKSPAIKLSPPLFIREGKEITKYKNAQLLTLNLILDPGEMSILCIGPRELFDDQLDYREK